MIKYFDFYCWEGGDATLPFFVGERIWINGK